MARWYVVPQLPDSQLCLEPFRIGAGSHAGSNRAIRANPARCQRGLSPPNSIPVDATGSVYIADANNRRVRRVASQGNISTVAAFSTPSDTVPYHIGLLVTGSSISPLLKIAKGGGISTFTN